MATEKWPFVALFDPGHKQYLPIDTSELRILVNHAGHSRVADYEAQTMSTGDAVLRSRSLPLAPAPELEPKIQACTNVLMNVLRRRRTIFSREAWRIVTK